MIDTVLKFHFGVYTLLKGACLKNDVFSPEFSPNAPLLERSDKNIQSFVAIERAGTRFTQSITLQLA